MSGNQKPNAAGGQQMPRYSSSPYQPIPPQQQRETFHVTTQSYVPQQQPNQGNNQGAGLRNIQQTGPPNQAPTPPNTDLKVQSVPQQSSMNPMFATSSSVPVRSVAQQPSFYNRASGPPNQTQRMSNQPHRTQQQIYSPAQTTQYVQMQMPPPSMYIHNMPYYNAAGQRPQNFIQPAPVVFSTAGHNLTAYPYTPAPSQTTSVPYSFYQIPRAGPQQQPAAAPTNQTQAVLPSVPLAQPVVPQNQMYPTAAKQPKKRPHRLQIIDPVTGQDILSEDSFGQENSSHPPSGESSARQTPQPATHHNPNKEVQATFAKQVAQAISNEESSSMDEDHQSTTSGDHSDASSTHHHAHHPQPTVMQVQHPTIDQLVLTSNLKVQAKEFVLPNIAKETPIVSANCDAVEVTLPNKKDRESPAKSRKQREQQQQQQQQQLQQIRDVKEVQPVKEEAVQHKPKETAPVVNVNVPAVATPPANAASVIKDPPANTKEEKKGGGHRRDSRDSPKVVVPGVDTNEITPNVPPLAEQESSVSANAKKQNTSQSKDGQRPLAPSQQQPQPPVNQKSPAPAPAIVPTPQPAKATSKSSKKIDLNSKGANKEGTDMDVFDNLDSVNANVPTNANVVVNNDIINSNETATTFVVAPVAAPPAAAPVVVDSNSVKIENDLPTIKPVDAKKKPKVDVTDIFGDKLNATNVVKPFLAQSVGPPPSTVATDHARDETDRVSAYPTTDKLVQAKNEANAKISSENSDINSVMEIKAELPYREGQWTPQNKDGKKVYDKDFLLALKDKPSSKVKPTQFHLPESIIPDDRVPRMGDGRFAMGGRSDFINPPFNNSNYGGKSGSQRGASITKQKSQSGGGKSGSRQGNKPNNGSNKISISLREDVKLHETENAWKPARMAKGVAISEDDKKTNALYKKVRGVLNKLTPQKFDTLVGQVRDLQIDTESRLHGVIDLVFEKAVDEPSFSVAYANMCKELALLQVPTANSTEERKDYVNFRKLLITRCQQEFEKQSIDESVRNDKCKIIDDCTDSEKKKELELELEEYDRRIRMKSVGNIRFIGELYRIQMLTASIMMKCLDNLLSHIEEENLECLCKLLSTIGRELENYCAGLKEGKKVDFNKYFVMMKEIVDKKHGRISSRIRFMLQDVMDLRKNKWTPRRQDSNPKTIDQIQKEAENEQMTINAMNSVPNMPRKDERTGGGGGGSGGGSGGGGGGGSMANKRKNNVSDDGWTHTHRNNRSIPFTVQSDKLKNKPPQIDEPLGSSHMFGSWTKGSNIKTSAMTQPVVTNANKFAALESVDTDKRISYGGPRSNRDPYSSKGSSLERSTYHKPHHYEQHGSRSGSQHRMDAAAAASALGSSQQQHRSLGPMSIATAAAAAAPVEASPVVAALAPPKEVAAVAASELPQLDEAQMARHVKNSLDEYTNDNCDIDEYFTELMEKIPPSYLSKVVADGYMSVLEKFTSLRIKTGSLFAKLITSGRLPLEDYCIGLEDVLSQAEDIIIDVPKLWDYLAEVMVKLITEEALPLNRLHKSFEVLISSGYAPKLLAALFKLVIGEKGPNFLQNAWQLSGLTFEDFMKPEEVDDFVSNNQLEFLNGGGAPIGKTELSYEQIQKKLSEFFVSNAAFDDIVNWISANVGDRVTEKKFIRTLATAIYTHSISNTKLVALTLKGHYTLLQKYVDNNQAFELQCLYACHSLVNKLEHPQGLLLSIFDRLYEDVIIPYESFIAWEGSTDLAEQEDKGVALKQLTCFFTQLKENDEDDEYVSTDAEDA